MENTVGTNVGLQPYIKIKIGVILFLEVHHGTFCKNDGIECKRKCGEDGVKNNRKWCYTITGSWDYRLPCK